MITVKRLLNRPVFKHATLLAGQKGLIRKVGWVHILEVSTSSPFVNQDDLILTTGIGFQQQVDIGVSYLQALIEQGAAGLCIELGEYVSEVPKEMIVLANQHHFPLIIFTQTVRFVEITQDVHALIIQLQQQLLEESRYEHQEALVEKVLAGGREEELLQQIGLPLFKRHEYVYLGGVVEIERNWDSYEQRNQEAVLLLRRLFKKQHLDAFLMLKNNVIYIFIVKAAWAQDVYLHLKHTLTILVEEFKNMMEPAVLYVGFGRAKNRIEEVKGSFQEAFQVVSVTQMKESSLFYEQLGIYQILKNVEREEILQEFAWNHLGKVIEFDRKTSSELLKTLDVLLQCGGSKQEAAKQLFIHRQTMYHRLDRLQELLGEGFLEAERRLCLEIALRIVDIQDATFTMAEKMTTDG